MTTGAPGTAPDVSERISFSVPLPPVSLRGNTRAHWAQKKRDADAYSADVFAAMSAPEHIGHWPVQPWEKAHVTYTWKYAAAGPDHSNLGGNTKYLQDILCVAPKLSPTQAAKYERWHLGLVENDAGIIAEYHSQKVPHRAAEGVDIVIERRR